MDETRIQCAVYKGNKEQELYVYVPEEAGEENIPDVLKERMGRISLVMNLELTPDRKLARADITRVMAEIRSKGYYLQLPPDITGQVLHDGD